LPKAHGGSRRPRKTQPFCPSTEQSAGWNRAADERNCFEPALKGPSGAEKRSQKEESEFTGCGKIFLSLSHPGGGNLVATSISSLSVAGATRAGINPRFFYTKSGCWHRSKKEMLKEWWSPM